MLLRSLLRIPRMHWRPQRRPLHRTLYRRMSTVTASTAASQNDPRYLALYNPNALTHEYIHTASTEIVRAKGAAAIVTARTPKHEQWNEYRMELQHRRLEARITPYWRALAAYSSDGGGWCTPQMESNGRILIGLPSQSTLLFSSADACHNEMKVLGVTPDLYTLKTFKRLSSFLTHIHGLIPSATAAPTGGEADPQRVESIRFDPHTIRDPISDQLKPAPTPTLHTVFQNRGARNWIDLDTVVQEYELERWIKSVASGLLPTTNAKSVEESGETVDPPYFLDLAIRIPASPAEVDRAIARKCWSCFTSYQYWPTFRYTNERALETAAGGAAQSKNSAFEIEAGRVQWTAMPLTDLLRFTLRENWQIEWNCDTQYQTDPSLDAAGAAELIPVVPFQVRWSDRAMIQSAFDWLMQARVDASRYYAARPQLQSAIAERAEILRAVEADMHRRQAAMTQATAASR